MNFREKTKESAKRNQADASGFFLHSRLLVKDFFLSFPSLLKKGRFYLFTFLQISALILASFAFYSNSYNDMWAMSLDMQDKIVDNNYSCLAIRSEIVTAGDSASRATWSGTGTTLNTYANNDGFTMASFVEADGGKSEFDVALGGSHGKSTVGDFFTYLQEEVDSDFFSQVKLLRYDNSSVGKDFRSYPFDGKNGSAYISSVLADELIANDPTKSLITYDDLLGKAFIVSKDGHEFLLSVNNIYFDTEYFGPDVKAVLSDPIITNCLDFYTFFPSRTFACVKANGLTFISMVERLNKATLNGGSIDSVFVDRNGAIFETGYENLNSVSSKIGSGESFLASGTNILLMLLLFLVQVAQFTIIAVEAKTDLAFDRKTAFSLSLFYVLSFCIVSGIIWGALRSSLVFYYVHNFGFGIVGIAVPIVFFLLYCVMCEFRSMEKKSQ